MVKPKKFFSETIQLVREDHVDLKTWIAPITNYDGQPLTKKELHKMILRKFLSRKDWQQEILNDIELKRQAYAHMDDPKITSKQKLTLED